MFEQHNCSDIRRCTIPGDEKSCTVEEGTGVTRYSEGVRHPINLRADLGSEMDDFNATGKLFQTYDIR